MNRKVMALLVLATVGTAATALEAQALWQRKDAAKEATSWYTPVEMKPRVWRKHDLVLIRIRESRTANLDDKFNSKKSFEHQTEIGDFIRLGGFGSNGLPKLNPSTTEGLDIDFSSETENDSQGRRSRRSNYSDVIMAEVTNVMPGYDARENRGQLMIRAYKQITIGNELERVELTGRIEVGHIDVRESRDEIAADRVFGAEIKYTGEGDISDNAKMGWFAKIFSWVWPF